MEDRNTSRKKRAQIRKRGRENVESQKEVPQEIAASQVYTGTRKRGKRGRENIENEKEEQLNTSRKNRAQARKHPKNTTGNIESEKQEIVAWVEEEELNTGTKKRGQGRKRSKNTRENVENQNESRGLEEKEKERVEELESLQDNASQPRNRKRKGNLITSNMCHQC